VDADLAPLVDLSARLREIAERASRVTAELAAPDVEKAARGTARAGTSPEGSPWTPTQAGNAPLRRAADAISVTVSGVTVAVVTLVLRGYHVFHHRGVGKAGGIKKSRSTAKGGGIPKRPILPTGDTLQPEIVAALAKAARKAVTGIMGGER
jgi:hypothetical protein